MSKVRLKIIQPSCIKIDKDFDSVIIPGVEGYFEVLYGHTPFLTKIAPGVLKAINEDKADVFAIHDGFVTVENNTITIITELIERDNEIDMTRAENARIRAEKRLASLSSTDIDFRRVEIALRKAVSRIQTVNN